MFKSSEAESDTECDAIQFRALDDITEVKQQHVLPDYRASKPFNVRIYHNNLTCQTHPETFLLFKVKKNSLSNVN